MSLSESMERREVELFDRLVLDAGEMLQCHRPRHHAALQVLLDEVHDVSCNDPVSVAKCKTHQGPTDS